MSVKSLQGRRERWKAELAFGGWLVTVYMKVLYCASKTTKMTKGASH